MLSRREVFVSVSWSFLF